MTSTKHYRPVFDRSFDLVVVGSGYAAFAASLRAQANNWDVLLLSRRPDVVWESGRAFAGAPGASASEMWQRFRGELMSRGGASDSWLDGAVAEVVATSLLIQAGVRCLFWASPVALDLDPHSGLAASLRVATKQGVKRVLGRRWIDATESGELARLRGVELARGPASLTMRAFLQHQDWRALPPSGVEAGRRSGPTLHPTVWETERCLRVDLPGNAAAPRLDLWHSLEEAREQLAPELEGSVVSHCCSIPFPTYAPGGGRPGGQRSVVRLPDNLVLAAASAADDAQATLAQRFDLGDAAAGEARHRPPAADSAISAFPAEPSDTADSGSQPELDDLALREAKESDADTTDIGVAGAGTGGALAAIAAARHGCRVTCVDLLPPGGVGTTGGVHVYYFGVRGGLQDEIDERVRAASATFAGRGQVRGFHPEAKKMVLERMFHDHGVRFLDDHLVYGAVRHGRRVTAALLAGPWGGTVLRASCWVDATGDGDLCVFAGADSYLGRAADGRTHHYFQSIGRVEKHAGGVRMRAVNGDSGWVDASDVEDLTRGRLLGVRRYLQPRYSAFERPTYVAPLIGLRQSRQIVTEYAVTLADLIEQRSFADSVGFTGAHYDNHSVDYEMESDEALFWVWVCRQWRGGRTACEMPYRMLVPQGIDNIWIGCRAAGVTIDAHHSLRMQRDVQRLGEAAGLSASIACEHGCDAASLPIGELQEELTASGALDRSRAGGWSREAGAFYDHINYTPAAQLAAGSWEEQLQNGLAALRRGEPCAELWYVYRSRAKCEGLVVDLVDSEQPTVSWLAAAFLAMWEDGRAEARLLRAIETLEYGFDDAAEAERPERNNRVVPHWMVAVSLLRCCASERCLPALQSLAERDLLLLNARTAIALTLGRLVQRGILGAEHRGAVASITARIRSGAVPGRRVTPQETLGAVLVDDQRRRHTSAVGGEVVDPDRPLEDHRWQLDLAVARLQLSLGMDSSAELARYRTDARRIVRRAFAGLAAGSS